MKWFVVIYPHDDELRAYLDALIFLANPMEKDAAHITIQGPKSSAKNVSSISQQIRGKKVAVMGVGRFFEGQQNTVYLRMDGEIIRKFWDKPNLPYRPHLTIYDGPSRPFAEKIYEILSRTRPWFQMVCGDCQTVNSISGQKSLKLLLNLDKNRLASVMGMPFDVDTIKSMPEYRRIMFMERICPQLNTVARNRKTVATKKFSQMHVSTIELQQ